MIRTMIVDDEYLVRQGLIHILPWSQFDMEIVAEADNGESALQYMAEHDVDLLITDLTMPVMNGFELMEQVRNEYPQILTVVLTCHQDFDYVQDALTLGALDYMVKTQLEPGKVESVLRRITDRMKQLRDTRYIQTEQQPAPVQWGMLVIPDANHLLNRNVHDLEAEERAAPIVLLDNQACFIPKSGQPDALEAERLASRLERHGAHSLIMVSGLQSYHASEAALKLNGFLERDWFYIKQAGKRVYELAFERMAGQVGAEPMCEWGKAWRRFAWLFDREAWASFEQLTVQSRPDKNKLKQHICETISGWAEIFHQAQLSRLARELKEAGSWSRSAELLQEIRMLLGHSAAAQQMSKEVCMSIMQAVEQMKRELHSGVGQEDIARSVNISRGYFSKCFKDLIGIPFNEAMKSFRIRKAKELLKESNGLPVYRIAEKTGFQDERYFSKVFREAVGMLPSEYRSRHAASDSY